MRPWTAISPTGGQGNPPMSTFGTGGPTSMPHAGREARVLAGEELEREHGASAAACAPAHALPVAIAPAAPAATPAAAIAVATGPIEVGLQCLVMSRMPRARAHPR
jgi:hypothetical protein